MTNNFLTSFCWLLQIFHQCDQPIQTIFGQKIFVDIKPEKLLIK